MQRPLRSTSVRIIPSTTFRQQRRCRLFLDWEAYMTSHLQILPRYPRSLYLRWRVNMLLFLCQETPGMSYFVDITATHWLTYGEKFPRSHLQSGSLPGV